jgi:hypothetical protein
MTNANQYNRLRLIMLYSSLDMFLVENPDILITLDNPDNLYSYSDKLKLFDAINMLENKYTSFSMIDLKIRCVHYVVNQYEILEEFINYAEKEIIKIKSDNPDNPAWEQYHNAKYTATTIKTILHDMTNELLLVEDLQWMPGYLLNILAEKKLYKVEN